MTITIRRTQVLSLLLPLVLSGCLCCCSSPDTVRASDPLPVAPGPADEVPALADVEPVPSLGHPGHGGPTCGLGKDFHAGRRAALVAELGETGYVLVRGLPETRGYTEFRQDKTFWYLTGVESPDASLFIDLASGLELLFLPKRNRSKEGWEGELWDSDDEWVRSLTGFAHVRPAEELDDFLAETVGEGDTVFISKHPWVVVSGCADRAKPSDRRAWGDSLDGRVSREQALEDALVAQYGVTVRDCADVLGELRRVKTPEEIDALRRAGVSGARAMVEAIRSTAGETGEWELDGVIDFVQQQQGADGMAYHAIVGSGPNSCVLHYSASSRRMHDGDLILIDAGSEVDHYTTDITRTWPVNGRFDEHQAALYDAVLAAQEAGLAMARPGKTMVDVDKAANDVLRQRGFGGLIKHGVCHYVGMEVHDTGAYTAPFEPGVVFTIEPGAYDTETGDGVRIEDVVLITADGCEILTRDVPVSRAAMEALVSEPGLLDSLRSEG